MSLKLLGLLEFDLDLAFSGYVQNRQDGVNFAQESFCFNDSEFWRYEIMIWLDYMRKNFALSCPKIVRDISSLSIGLQFTDDYFIRKLNTEWRNKPEKTDVLAFSALDESLVFPGNDCVELGDIVVSVQTAQNQAFQHKHSLETELRWLVSHGFLHLLGLDHPDPNKLKEMLSLQEHLLRISGNLQSMAIKEENL